MANMTRPLWRPRPYTALPTPSAMLTRAALLMTAALLPSLALAAPRPLSFRVPEDCGCFTCSVQSHRAIDRFEGVRKTTLSSKEHRMDVLFEEGTKAVSDLAAAIAKLDIGKGSALAWPVPQGADPARVATTLAALPGVRVVKTDAKAGAVLLTFTGKPAVRLAQLDAAMDPSAGEPAHE